MEEFSELDAAACTALFQEKTALVKRLKAENADRAVLVSHARQMSALKRRHRQLLKAAKRKRPERIARGVACYPAFCALPRCERDPRFAKDFDLQADIAAGVSFFREYGFVVWRGVLTAKGKRVVLEFVCFQLNMHALC